MQQRFFLYRFFLWLIGVPIFFDFFENTKSYRGRYTSPALAAASYPFVDLPSGDTLRCKLFPNGKFHKICYLFDS